MDTFFFYDLETSGRDPRWHRITQFAGVRTDSSLTPVAAPVAWNVRLDDDVVPEPEACLITGLTPARIADGIDEGELFRRIDAEFGRPRTCVVGYNNLRFDDEFVRYGFWRNLMDPYAREWQGGNSRWDLIDLARMAAALRPAGMVWPESDGRASFRLEELAAANAIEQTRAHDALADVQATVGLARALRLAQPELFDFYLGLRQKQRVAEVVGRPLGGAFVHVSSRYGAASGRLAVVTPIAAHPVNRNSMIVADLSADTEALERLDGVALAAALFTPARERGERPFIPLKEIHFNKVPAVAPLGVLKAGDQQRLGIDLPRCLLHLERLRRAPDLAERVQAAYAARPAWPRAEDVDGALYDGFLPDDDRRLLLELPAAYAEGQVSPPPLTDARARELAFRYLARRRPELLDAEGRARWQAHRHDLLIRGRDGMDGIPATRLRLDALAAGGADVEILDALRAYLDQLEAEFAPSPSVATS